MGALGGLDGISWSWSKVTSMAKQAAEKQKAKPAPAAQEKPKKAKAKPVGTMRAFRDAGPSIR